MFHSITFVYVKQHIIHFFQTFSADARWLVSASMDCTIRVWDLPTSSLIDCMRFENAPTSVCFSPTSAEFLATTHINELGVFLWSNKTLYTHVPLKPLSDDYEPPATLAMPSTAFEVASTDSRSTNGHENIDESTRDYDDYKNYVSPEQLAFELITLSLLPQSRWKHLINLDINKVSR